MLGVVCEKLELIFKMYVCFNFFLLCVIVLKSLNYVCKNLTYVYICMKVYNLVGTR